MSDTSKSQRVPLPKFDGEKEHWVLYKRKFASIVRLYDKKVAKLLKDKVNTVFSKQDAKYTGAAADQKNKV